MDRFQLSYVLAVLVLCVALARGLDRWIVEPSTTWVVAPGSHSSTTATTRVSSAHAPPPPHIANTPPLSNIVESQEQRIPVARDGHYYADAEINGWQLKHMMIDTGATYVALSYEDAASLGIYPGPGDYKYETRTANGTAHDAAVTLREVRLGDIVVENVQAVVGERGMLDVSLLGMSFLSRLSRVEATDSALALRR